MRYIFVLYFTKKMQGIETLPESKLLPISIKTNNIFFRFMKLVSVHMFSLLMNKMSMN